VNHSTNKIKIFAITLLIMGMPISTNAATYYFEPATTTFTRCTNTIQLMIDATGENSNSADIEIFFDPTKIEINDRDSSQSGIQIREGDAYTSYWGNITYQNTGRIFLAGGSLPDNTITLNTLRTFAYIDFEYIGEPLETVTFEIRLDNIGNTRDSNIASSIDGSDLLLSKIDGTYTFNTPPNCHRKSTSNPEVIDEILPIPTEEPIPTNVPNMTPTISQISQELPVETFEQKAKYERFVDRKNIDSEYLYEHGIKVSNLWILSCVSLQVGLLIFLFFRRKKIHHAIIRKELLVQAVSQFLKQEKIWSRSKLHINK
jgi:hypothetical protein